MATYRAQVVFPMFTNLPEDVATNTFHFTELTPLGLAAVAAAVTPLLADFYTDVYTAARQMGNYMNPGAATVRWYDLSEPQPRVPLIVPLAATIAVGASTVPTETSCVLSFQGDRAPGIPQARRRGRIYLPALATTWMVGSTTGTFPTFNLLATGGVATAAEALRDAAILVSARWSVWSTVDGAATFVTNGWVDNTPDTQRRRGVEPSNRLLWS